MSGPDFGRFYPIRESKFDDTLDLFCLPKSFILSVNLIINGLIAHKTVTKLYLFDVLCGIPESLLHLNRFEPAFLKMKLNSRLNVIKCDCSNDLSFIVELLLFLSHLQRNINNDKDHYSFKLISDYTFIPDVFYPITTERHVV